MSAAAGVFVNDHRMEYKAYVGSAHYSAADEVFHGKLEGIRDLITYEATDEKSISTERKNANRRIQIVANRHRRRGRPSDADCFSGR